MIDYKKWVKDAVEFTRGLSKLPGELDVTCEAAPPLAPAELASISARFPSRLPRELGRFWTEGSAYLNCRYWWKPDADAQPQFWRVFPRNDFLWGGASFLNAQDFPLHASDDEMLPFPPLIDFESRAQSILDSVLAGLEVEGDPGDGNWASLPLVLHLLGSGDYIALHPEMTGADPDDPPVVLFDHELGGIGMVADRFTEFLQAWESWSYIGLDRLAWWPTKSTSGTEVAGRAPALRALLQGT